MQTVFEATPLSLTLYKILYDPTGQVEYFEIRLFNAFTERTTGLTTQQVVGKRYGQVFPTILKTGVLEVFKQVAHSGEPAVGLRGNIPIPTFARRYHNRQYRS